MLLAAGAAANAQRSAPVTQGEAAEAVIKALGLPPAVGPAKPAPAAKWGVATPYVERARGLGLTRAGELERFRPAEPATRGELAAMAARAVSRTIASPNGAQPAPNFADVPRSGELAGDIQAAVAWKLMKGFPDGTFRPAAPASRADLAVAASGIRKLVAEGHGGASAAGRGAAPPPQPSSGIPVVTARAPNGPSGSSGSAAVSGNGPGTNGPVANTPAATNSPVTAGNQNAAAPTPSAPTSASNPSPAEATPSPDRNTSSQEQWPLALLGLLVVGVVVAAVLRGRATGRGSYRG